MDESAQKRLRLRHAPQRGLATEAREAVITRLNHKLEGSPDRMLMAGLFTAAGVLVWIAFKAPPAAKAAALAWVIFP